jgi:hypothetical protein
MPSGQLKSAWTMTCPGADALVSGSNYFKRERSARMHPHAVIITRGDSRDGLTLLGSTALCTMLGAAVAPMIKLDRYSLSRWNECLRDRPVQDALSGLVSLLIQTPKSVRHPWSLG